MTYYLNFLFNNQTHKTSGGYYLNHDSLMAVNEEARKRLAFYFIAEQTPEKLDQTDFDTYKQISYQHYQIPFDILAVGALAYKTLLYRPKLVAPSPNVALLGFVGRALGFVILSSGYFHIANQVKESCLLKNNTVKDLANKYNFGVYDFGLARKEATIIRVNEMLRWS